MTGTKRHLLVARGRSACGLSEPRRGTRDPAAVTCQGCRKTLAMVDAEVNLKKKKKS